MKSAPTLSLPAWFHITPAPSDDGSSSPLCTVYDDVSATAVVVLVEITMHVGSEFSIWPRPYVSPTAIEFFLFILNEYCKPTSSL